MPGKENKTSVKSKSLSFRKTAKDAARHLDFSITKKVIHMDNYEALVKRRGYCHKRAAMLGAVPLLASGETKKQGSAKAESHALPVRRDALPRSPYVVRLLDEWESSARSALEPKNNTLKKTVKAPDATKDVRWLKEVERLRSQAASVSRPFRGVTIDLLGKKSKRTSKRALLRFKASELPALAVSGLAALVAASLRWLFEFVLSIPLGFLLAFTVLLTLVEVANRGAITAARAVGWAGSWAIKHAFFAVIASVRALVVIPIKLVSLAFLVVYRAVSVVGSSAFLASRALWESAANYVSVFSRPPKHLYQKLVALAFAGILAMLPVKFMETAPEQIRILRGSVLGATKEGYEGLASFDLAQAAAKFQVARADIDSLNLAMRAMVSALPAGQDSLRAIAAGDELAKAGAFLAAAFGAQEGSGEEGSLALLGRIRESLAQSLPHLESASANLAAIDSANIPPEFAEQFQAAQGLLPRLASAVAESSGLFATVADALGANGDKRYAILFQNNNELRPAGGFIGSLAFADVRDGAIANIEVPAGGPYDFQGYLSEFIKAPKPLSLINARWELQDANWYPDWPRSAEKVAWFLEHAGFSSVDGVIAVQATTLVALLRVTGPVEFPEHGVTLTSENVLSEIQTAVESGYDRTENKPKQYIAELLPRVLEKLLAASGNQMLAATALVKSEIKAKDILIYFRDPAANRAFAERGWVPSIVESDGDYLSVIHANIGGGKTDGVIRESWDQEVVIDRDGNAVAQLSIIREHTGDPGHPFEGYNNVDYVRVYAPAGSELVSFEGVKPPSVFLFKQPEPYYQEDTELASIEGKVIIDEATGTRITNEFGKTTFGNWLQVGPGNVLVARVKYKLPFRVKPFDLLNFGTKTGYSLVMQKQAGSRPIPYSVSLRYPSDWSVSWQKAVGQGRVQLLGPGLVTFEGELGSDTGFAVSFEE